MIALSWMERAKVKAMTPEQQGDYVFGPVNVRIDLPALPNERSGTARRVMRTSTSIGKVGGMLKTDTKGTITTVVTQHHCDHCSSTWRHLQDQCTVAISRMRPRPLGRGEAQQPAALHGAVIVRSALPFVGPASRRTLGLRMIDWRGLILWLRRAWPVLAFVPVGLVHGFAIEAFRPNTVVVNRIVGVILQIVGGLIVLYSVNDNLGLFKSQSLCSTIADWFKAFPIVREPIALSGSGSTSTSGSGTLFCRGEPRTRKCRRENYSSRASATRSARPVAHGRAGNQRSH